MLSLFNFHPEAVFTTRVQTQGKSLSNENKFLHWMFPQLIKQSVCTFFLKLSFFSSKHKNNHNPEKMA